MKIKFQPIPNISFEEIKNLKPSQLKPQLDFMEIEIEKLEKSMKAKVGNEDDFREAQKKYDLANAKAYEIWYRLESIK